MQQFLMKEEEMLDLVPLFEVRSCWEDHMASSSAWQGSCDDDYRISADVIEAPSCCLELKIVPHNLPK